MYRRNSTLVICFSFFICGLMLFAVGCREYDNILPDENFFGNVYDIDGNEYKTVIIGNQEWMAENLRVSKYNNGDAIPTGLSDVEWHDATDGAYAIYPHQGGGSEDDVVGINSDEEMVGAYGKLYNWHAVDNTRGLCPAGWHVPSDQEWTQLVDYLMEEYDYHNVWAGSDIHGVGNALKSCRQPGSPIGGNCNTYQHPRWYPHEKHHGFDEHGFSLLPGGSRIPSGTFFILSRSGYWWSATEHSATYAWHRVADFDIGSLNSYFADKRNGYSVRCVKAAD